MSYTAAAADIAMFLPLFVIGWRLTRPAPRDKSN